MGGYFAGCIDTRKTDSDGLRYAIFIGPKQFCEFSFKIVNDINGNVIVTNSKWNGYDNTLAMMNKDIINNHPAASNTKRVTYNGFNDYYIPAIDELELMYRHFKPNDTLNNTIRNVYAPYDCLEKNFGYNPSSYPIGDEYTQFNPSRINKNCDFHINKERFRNRLYWSSTGTDTESQYCQNFHNGCAFKFYSKDNNFSIRLIRRVLIEDN
jgi:hypothetical protein